MTATFLITIGVFLLGAVGMGLSLLLNRPTNCMQRGTCGGTPIEVGGVKMTCSTCPNRDQPGHQVGTPTCSAPPADVEHSHS